MYVCYLMTGFVCYRNCIMTSNSNNLQFFPAESKSYNWKGFTAIVVHSVWKW
jgi:hypothetical protein